MKIAVLTNDYPPESQGGAGVIAEKQVIGLRDHGHEVRVWHERAHWLSAPIFTRLTRHLFDIFPRKQFVHEIESYKPDVLITHNLTGLGFGTPKKIKDVVDCDWIHILHDIQLFDPSGSMKHEDRISAWHAFWTWWRRFTFGSPDLILSPTKWLADAHKARDWFKHVPIEVLPNPGLPQEFVLRHPHEPFRLLFLGGVSKVKGFDQIRKLQKRLGSNFVIHVAGAAPPMESSHGLRFHGRLNPEQVISLMNDMDVLLVPSQIVENQPTVILEAASVGLPVIASDIGGVKETLGKAGKVCPPKSLDVWQKAIEDHREPGFYQEKATAMFELARRYSPKRHLERLNYFVTEKRKTRT